MNSLSHIHKYTKLFKKLGILFIPALILISISIIVSCKMSPKYKLEDVSNVPKPIPKILWNYRVNGTFWDMCVSPSGNFYAVKNYTHVMLFNRTALLWNVECKGTDVVVDNLGRCYVVSTDKVYVYNAYGQLIKLYSAPQTAVITCIDVDRHGRYAAIGWDDGIVSTVDIMMCSDSQEFPWIPYARFNTSSDKSVDLVKFAWDSNKILVAGKYTSYGIYVINYEGRVIWNTSVEFDFADIDPSGEYVLVGKINKIILYRNGSILATITPQNLTADNPSIIASSIYYAHLTEKYIVITSPKINIIRYKVDCKKVIWGEDADADTMPPYGDHIAYYDYEHLYLFNIYKGLLWNLKVLNCDETDISEYGTFILVHYHNVTDNYVMCIASYPDTILTAEPSIIRNEVMYVCENTSFMIVSEAVAPGIDSYYSIDGGAFLRYLSPFNLKDYSEGSHLIKYFCVDSYGLKSSIKNVSVILDRTPPNVRIIEPRNGSVVGPTFRLNVSAIDNFVGLKSLEYRVDDGVWKEFDGNENISVGGGYHTIYIRARDLFNHTSVEWVQVFVDDQHPSLEIISPAANSVTGSEIEIIWNATDNTGILYFEIKIDDSTWKNIGKNTSYRVSLKPGEHTIYVKAVDLAHLSTTKSIKFRVGDTIPISWFIIIGVVLAVSTGSAFFLLKKRR